jgi:hypothetical protein
MGLQRSKSVSFPVEMNVEVADHRQDQDRRAVIDEHGAGALGMEQLPPPPVHFVEFDQAVVQLLGMAVLFPQCAVGVGQVVVDVHSIDLVAVHHPGVTGTSVIGQTVGALVRLSPGLF